MTAAVIRIFESELEQITERVMGNPTTETGGELIGLWSHADSPTILLAGVTIVLAGGPAGHSHRGATHFEQDPETHMGLERLVWEQFGVQVVGMWHSHHQLSLHDLSGGDVRRTISYSTRHSRPRYSEILAYIVRREQFARDGIGVGLRPHVYENASTGVAVNTTLEVLPGDSPLRQALSSQRVPANIAEALDDARRRRGRPVPFIVEDHYPHSTLGETVREDGDALTDAEAIAVRVESGGTTDVGRPPKDKQSGVLKVLGRRGGGRGLDQTGQLTAEIASRAGDVQSSQLELLERIINALPRDITPNLRVVDDPETGVTEIRLPNVSDTAELVVHVAGLGSPDMIIRASMERRFGPRVTTELLHLSEPPSAQALASVLTQGAVDMGYMV